MVMLHRWAAGRCGCALACRPLDCPASRCHVASTQPSLQVKACRQAGGRTTPHCTQQQLHPRRAHATPHNTALTAASRVLPPSTPASPCCPWNSACSSSCSALAAPPLPPAPSPSPRYSGCTATCGTAQWGMCGLALEKWQHPGSNEKRGGRQEAGRQQWRRQQRAGGGSGLAAGWQLLLRTPASLQVSHSDR